jgi:hypothetical protein
MEPAGQARLRVVRIAERAPFEDPYEIAVTGTHVAATNWTGMHATFVLRGPTERKSANTYYPVGEVPTDAQYTDVMNQELAARNLARVLDVLGC